MSQRQQWEFFPLFTFVSIKGRWVGDGGWGKGAEWGGGGVSIKILNNYVKIVAGRFDHMFLCSNFQPHK